MAMELRSLPTLSTSAKAAGQEGRCMSCSGKSFVRHIRCGVNICFSDGTPRVEALCWQASLLWKHAGLSPPDQNHTNSYD